MWLFRDRFVFSATLVGYPLLSLGLGLLVACSISPQVLASLHRALPGRRGERVRSLSAQCFAVIATLAYSLYLTHKELAHLCRAHLDSYMQSGGWPALALTFIASICVAILLYLVIERPFLRLRERLSVRYPARTESAVAS
jgi:peptidoglycan/LPS O-acetylase OafA/YrhL